MHNIGTAGKTICRFYKAEKETLVQVMCHCKGLTRARFLVWSIENPTVHNYIKKPLSNRISCMEKAKLESEDYGGLQ